VAWALSGVAQGAEPPHGSLLAQAERSRRVGAISVGGQSRLALLETSSFDVSLPERVLLTFGVGLSGPAADAWTYRVRAREGGKIAADVTVVPGTHRWWDFSVPLAGGPRKARLSFEIDVRDEHGARQRLPAGVALGVADPSLHDAADYGRSKAVLLISIDTLRRDHVGLHGYDKPTTPRLDVLGQHGITCDDAVSTSSWTLPAHLSMLTSVDPATHGGVDRDHGFSRAVPTLPELLRTAGFATQAVTSHLYVSSVYGLDAGFDQLNFKQDRSASDVAEQATALLDRFGDRPFFLFLHFYDPHWNYTPPASMAKLFPSPPGRMTGWYRDFSRRSRQQTSPDDLKRLLSLYDGEIRYTNDQIGHILDHLQSRGLQRSTLVVVTSDHGEEFLEHGSWEHQKTLYEEVVRIPLLVSGPGIAPRVERRQASLLDVAPTVLAWAGVAIPAVMQGRSLLEPLPEREAYGETDHVPDGTRKVFLRTGSAGSKLVLSVDRTTDELRGAEWYDLAVDPGETRPAAQVPPDVRRRALDRWREARARGRAAPPIHLNAEQLEGLRALGYVSP
jgi:arylsulfatase A-like enzyme